MSPTISDAADAALAALALVEACNEDNEINKQAIIDGTPPADLVLGLVCLASSMRASLAVALQVPLADLDEATRAMFLSNTIGGAS